MAEQRTTNADPGWYEDPERERTRRYWDGAEWTDHRIRIRQVSNTSNGRQAAGVFVWLLAGVALLNAVGAVVAATRGSEPPLAAAAWITQPSLSPSPFCCCGLVIACEARRCESRLA